MTQSNFLNRWARKKAGVTEESVKDGSQQTAPGLVDKALQPDPALTPAPDDLTKPSETPQALTLEDVEKIDVKAADFSAFMRADVDPVVQQAAMKKMFSDPHFNVMDGLDIYIDDYTSPIPFRWKCSSAWLNPICWVFLRPPMSCIPSLRMPKRILIRKGMRNSRQIAKRP